MARRTSGVKEFGFWDISRSWVLDDDDGDGKQTAEKSKFLASSKARFLLLMGKTKKPQKSMERWFLVDTLILLLMAIFGMS